MHSPQPTTATFDAARLAPFLSEEQRRQVDALPSDIRSNPFALLDELQRRGWLTGYQVQEIADGRAARLLLGPYVILDRLGEGGMGQVFKARHRDLRRLTALKVIRPDRISGTALARFKQEAQAAAALRHPNVVLIYDCAEIDGVAFAAMEFIEGIDLHRLSERDGPLPIATACDFIRQAAFALQHAHEHGLIHRDIKPSNLIATATSPPVVKVLDFGLARLEGEPSQNLTTSGQVMGTLAYIAPEQAENAKNADIRSDIFSLGCTLFELLTRQNPYPGTAGLETLKARWRGDAMPLGQVRPDAPAALEAVIAKMLARDPEERYRTPGQVADELAPFAAAPVAVSGKTTVDFPASGPAKAAILHSASSTIDLPSRSSRTVAETPVSSGPGKRVLGVSAVLAAIAVAVFLIVRNRGDNDGPEKPAPKTDRSGNSGNVAQEVLPMPREFAVRPAPDDKFIICGDPRFRHFGPVRCLAVSPNGKWIASAGRLPTGGIEFDFANHVDFVTLWNAETGEVIATTQIKKSFNEVLCLAFSPDNRYLAAGCKTSGPLIWDMTADKPLEKPAFFIASVNNISQILFLDGKTLWTMRGGSVGKWELRQPRPADLGEVTKLPVLSNRICATPDGKMIAFVSQIGATLFVRNFDGKETKDRAVLKQAPHEGAIAISPDGKRLAVGGNPLQIIDLSMPEPGDLLGLKLDPFAPGHPSSVAFNADGTLLAVGRDDGVLQLWRQTKNGAEKISELRGHDNEVTALAFHKGELLVSGSSDHRVRIWKTTPNLAPRDEADGLDPSGIISGVAFTPDGQNLVLASRTSGTGVPHSRVDVRTAATGKLDRAVERSWNITAMQLLPDGHAVIFGGREFLGQRTNGRLFWSEWHWRDEPLPRESHPFTGNVFGADVRIAISPMTGNVAILGVAPIEVMPGHIELRRSKDITRLEGMCKALMARQIALSADGKRLAIGCDAVQFKKSGSTIRIYETAKLEGRIRDKINDTLPEPLIECEGRMENLTALAFAPNGDTLAAADTAGTLLLLNPNNGKQKKSLRQEKTGGVFLTLAYSKDGKQLAGGTDDGRVLTWSTEDWSEGPNWTFPGPVYSLAFDPDGKRLAVGLGNGTAVILKLP